MTIHIRVTKISGIPIENNASIKAVQVNLLGQDSSDLYSICRILPDPNDNKYQSIISSDKVWDFPIDINSPPCSIVVKLLNMEPQEMEIQRTILSSSWFKINTYVSEFFPLKPMVPCLGPAVALIDIHFIDPKSLPPNQIFKPFECPKGEMAISPRWRNLKPFVPKNDNLPNSNIDESNNNDNQNISQIPIQDTNDLKPLIPENEKESSSPTKTLFGLPGLTKRSPSKNDMDSFDFPNLNQNPPKKIEPYYVAYEKYSFDEKILQLKYDEFEKAKRNIQRRGSQNQIDSQNKRRGSSNQVDNNAKRRGSQNQIDNNTKRRESQNQISRPIPPIHNKKQNADNYQVID